MKIKIWGARGSIPVSGSDFVKYGGDTTCIEVRTKSDDVIIIDAGSGIRKLGNCFVTEKRRDFNMLFTHFHWDHIIGMPFFNPIYFQKTKVNFFGCPSHINSLNEILSNIMRAPYFPVPFRELKMKSAFHELAPEEPFSINGLEINSVPISHRNGGLGYRFREDGKCFVFMTDNELGFPHLGRLSTDEYAAFIEDADLFIHDAEYEDHEYQHTRGWGHSTFKEALDLAIAGKVKKFGMFHHNMNRTDQRLDTLVLEYRKAAGQAPPSPDLFACRAGDEFSL